MQKIQRNKRIEGMAIPIFIQNGSIFFVDLEVYEDGMVNCWELVDLEGLKEKLESKWLLPFLQTEKEININDLGSYKIGASKWQFDEKSFYEHVLECLQKINPKMENIYTISEEEKLLWEKRRVCHCPDATYFSVKQELFYETMEGRSIDIFYRFKGKVYLTRLTTYNDKYIVLNRLPSEQIYTLIEIEEMFSKGILFTEFQKTEWVIIYELGEIEIIDAIYTYSSTEKLREIQTNCKELGGSQSAFKQCQIIYNEYLKGATEELRQRLKEYYEEIPEHQRRYLGDMDCKDNDYRRIIYHPERKRWV